MVLMVGESIINKHWSALRKLFVQGAQATIKTREKMVFENILIGKNVIIEPGVVIYPNCHIKDDAVLATGCIIKPNCIIGEHSIIGTMTNLEGDNTIGSYTTIQAQCHITRGMSVGDNCFVGPNLVTVNTPKIGEKDSKFGYPNTTHMERKIPHIRDNCQIGGGVTLAPGVIIERGCIIGMNCFIKSNVLENGIVGAGTTWKNSEK